MKKQSTVLWAQRRNSRSQIKKKKSGFPAWTTFYFRLEDKAAPGTPFPQGKQKNPRSSLSKTTLICLQDYTEMVLSITTNFSSFLKFLQKFPKELEKNYFTVINGFIQQKQAQIIAAAKLTYEVLTFFFSSFVLKYLRFDYNPPYKSFGDFQLFQFSPADYHTRTLTLTQLTAAVFNKTSAVPMLGWFTSITWLLLQEISCPREILGHNGVVTEVLPCLIELAWRKATYKRASPATVVTI